MAKETPRRRLELKLKSAPRARGLRRCDDRLFEPVPGSPWAYREASRCDHFVRHTLRGDEDYRSHPSLPPFEVFPFDRVSAADAVLASLGDHIITEELPAVVARCVRAYLRLAGAAW